MHRATTPTTSRMASSPTGPPQGMDTDYNPEANPSPKKRGAPQEEALSLDAIREVVRGEIGVSTATLRTEIGARMDRVETGVTAQLQRTLERLQAITNQQHDQQQTVEAIQGDQLKMSTRLQTLEAKVQTLQQSTTGSTADTDLGGRKPALIMGGWGDDTPAEETLRGVQQMIRTCALTWTPTWPSCPDCPEDTLSCPTTPGTEKAHKSCEKGCRGLSGECVRPTLQWARTPRARHAICGCSYLNPPSAAEGCSWREVQATLPQPGGGPQPDRDRVAHRHRMAQGGQDLLSNHYQTWRSTRGGGRLDQHQGRGTRPGPARERSRRRVGRPQGGTALRHRAH